jgi:hypothetical protein
VINVTTGRSAPPKIHPVVKHAIELAAIADRMDSLLGQMIATLSLEQNRAHYRTMDAGGEEFIKLADRWAKEYEKIRWVGH